VAAAGLTRVVAARVAAAGEEHRGADKRGIRRVRHGDLHDADPVVRRLAVGADKYAQDKRVRSLAERIRASQAPEMQAMSTWLVERNMEVPRPGGDPKTYDHALHGNNSMLGILTPGQMKRLAAARGSRFDRLCLQGMIRHHEGAVEMAVDAAQDGIDMIVGEMTADVAATQSAEISRMQDLLTEL
jgi:uncharacterized protein (DUF305 family)